MTATAALKREFLSRHPGTAAQVFETLGSRSLSRALRGVPIESLLPVMELLTPIRLKSVFDAMDPDRQCDLLRSSSPHLALVILGFLDPDQQDQLLESLDAATRDELTRFLDFPENSAGRLMDRYFEAMRPTDTVAEALAKLRSSGIKQARVIYLVDEDNRVTAMVDVQDLALAEPDQHLSEILHPLAGVVEATATREELVELLDQRRLPSLPVVDVDGRLLGIVRYSTLFDTLENVVSADLQKMVGASADEKALSPAWFAIKRRLPWLHINLLTAFLAASVVGIFESIIAQFTALAILLPVVAGQSGNAGAQALAVTMRGLAMKEIGIAQWRHILTKELKTALVNGLALAVTCGAGVYFWSGSLGLALVIGIAMMLSLLSAGASGALVPIVLRKLGQDPATASSIILTTVTDVAGFFSFLGTATLLAFML